MERRFIFSKKYQYLIIGILVLLGLHLSSLYHYLLFHSLAEIFSIVVACGIFMVAWNARRFLENNYLLFIGIAYLFVAGLDLVHTFAYKGMNIFQGYETNLPTQLWIAARYMEGFSLFIASLFLRRKLRTKLVFLGYTVVTTLLLLSIFYWEIFPTCFIEGAGLTPFKKISEYIISLILLASIALLLKNRGEFDRNVLQCVIWSIILTIFSELAFTFYIHAYGFSNLVGHYFKIVSFYLLYKALIETGLSRPYDLLFRNLRKSEEALRLSFEETKQRQAEVSALLEAARAVLEYHEFKDSARSIFDSCKKLIGAIAGYIALLSKDGSENEVLFLDSGGLPCTVDPNLPMPIRGLREVTYRTGKAVYHNNFATSEYMEFMPDGHARLDNVLFAPLMIGGKVIGLLGLANKSGGFVENDARMASAFGELAAVALHNSRALEALEHNEERYRSLVQTASDAIISADGQGNIVFWNKSAESTFGHSIDEVIGKPLTFIIPERFREAHQKAMDRVASTGKSNIIGKTFEMAGLRRDGSEFPVEISLASWQTREGIFSTGIIRDVTERKRAAEALRKSRDELERRVQERTAELAKSNQALQIEIQERKQVEESLRKSEEQLRYLSSQLLSAEEKERKRISREIHDGIGQSLTAIRFRVENILQQVNHSRNKKMVEPLDTILPLVQQSIEESRRIQMDLRPSILDDLGISATLSWFCREFQTTYSGISIEKTIDINEDEVADSLKTVIYRISQEALNNVAKHSQADLVHLALRKSDGKIELAIRDNGQGFDLKEALSEEASKRGLGITSMRERTELSGGSFSIESIQGKGTIISAVWPISVRNADCRMGS